MPPITFMFNGLEKPIGYPMSTEEREDFIAFNSIDWDEINGFEPTADSSNDVIRRSW